MQEQCTGVVEEPDSCPPDLKGAVPHGPRDVLPPAYRPTTRDAQLKPITPALCHIVRNEGFESLEPSREVMLPIRLVIITKLGRTEILAAKEQM